jgi:hypothetical protein
MLNPVQRHMCCWPESIKSQSVLFFGNGMNFLENSRTEFKVGHQGMKVNFKFNNLISDFCNNFSLFFSMILNKNKTNTGSVKCSSAS